MILRESKTEENECISLKVSTSRPNVWLHQKHANYSLTTVTRILSSHPTRKSVPKRKTNTINKLLQYYSKSIYSSLFQGSPTPTLSVLINHPPGHTSGLSAVFSNATQRRDRVSPGDPMVVEGSLTYNVTHCI